MTSRGNVFRLLCGRGLFVDDCVELESDPAMVAVARQFVRDRLASWEALDYADDAMLVASELVSNAVLHARTDIQLRLACSRAGVRVEVFDENSRLPILAPCPSDATSGRGLALVSELATAWGVEKRDGGKVVWAEVGRTAEHVTDGCLDLRQANTVGDALDQVTDSGWDAADQ
jgi:anti-sigma regulatory factor (Ser/Thr protein kinase)